MSGPQCCANPPILCSSSGVGSVIEIGGLKAYVSGPSDSKLAIVLVSDIYGYEAPNFRKVVDKVAAAGFYVVAPDFFYGDPFIPGSMPLEVWMKVHRTDKGFEDAKSVIAELRSGGVNTIGTAGFCWGGKVAVELSKTNLIQVTVLLHPAKVTVDDINDVKVPIAILGAEKDHISPPALLKQFEEVLSTKPFNSYVKIFPGVDHGWSVRYKDDDEEAVKKAEEAHKNMIDWFVQYVK